jgi:hypothetical protein
MRKRKEKIFIGGPVHPDVEGKKKLAEAVARIEKVIGKHGLKFHPHLLTDVSVYKGTEHGAQQVRLGTKTFDKLMKGVPKPQVKRLRKIRWYENDDKLLRCATVGTLLSEQVATSIAGIFVLTQESPGSYFLAGELLGRQIPVLIVSDQNLFGTYATGHPSPFLQTARYATLDDLEKVADDFLSSLEDLRLESKSVRLPAVLRKRAEAEAEDTGTNFGELMIRALEEYLARSEESSEE